jgi:proteasome accessory factor C
VDRYAEWVELIDDGPDLARLQVTVLQPYRLRVGLMVVVGGASARVVSPAELRGAGAEVAREMLRRYDEEADRGE